MSMAGNMVNLIVSPEYMRVLPKPEIKVRNTTAAHEPQL
jgi:hypothetical protein